MKGKLSLTLAVSLALLASLFFVFSAAANPPAPDDRVFVGPINQSILPELKASRTLVKPIDQPNPKDLARNEERWRLLEAGQAAEANALALTGNERVLVILVEFAGTDVFTWTAPTNPADFKTGSQWDPIGKADNNEAVVDPDTGNTVRGNCSKIITQTKQFTYGPTLHNQIPRPISAADRSGDSIWTPDFSNAWFHGYLFGDGVTFNYTRTDGSAVNLDFTGESVKNYYKDLSDGQYMIDGDVIGWLQLPHSTWWYGADECPGARSYVGNDRPGYAGQIPGAGSNRSLVQAALDAVNAISPTISGFSWKNYDLNGDGVIDRLWIVHAGYGEEDAPTLLNRTDYSEAALWSHSSSVPLYPLGEGISAGPYIMMPENGGIGVFAHEAGHNMGSRDLYTYGNGDTSTGFWSLMSDDWTGYPIGFEPPSVDPYHLDLWGWLNPKEIVDPNRPYQVTVGQASEFPGGAGTYRGVKIRLPNSAAPLPVVPWQGGFYWWGGKFDQANGRMTTVNPIALTAAATGSLAPTNGTTATLSFDLVYDIEDQWDFLWIQVSTDSGATWRTLTNTNTSCVHDVAWIGEENGFPKDLCGAGLGGFTGHGAGYPAPQTQAFDLSPFVGQNILLRFWYMTDWGTTGAGPFVDNVQVSVGDVTKFADNAENGDANWTYRAPWVRHSGLLPFTHNYYLQWRNVSASGGSDRSLSDPRWRFGPANTGLLVWYNNNFYNDNEIENYLQDWPSYGPKGRMLVVDSHPDPYRDPYWVAQGYPNEGANLTSRGLMRDAPFSRKDTLSFNYSATLNNPNQAVYVHGGSASFAGWPAASVFDDFQGYYPGSEKVRRSPAQGPGWVTKQWDASVALPAKTAYPVNAPTYTGAERFRFRSYIDQSGGPNNGFLLAASASGRADGGLGYNGGTGNPGDYGADYGWRVQILSQTDMTATLLIWNTHYFGAFSPNKTVARTDERVTYSYRVPKNEGSPLSLFACASLDPNKATYVAGSATNGAIALTQPCNVVSGWVSAGKDLSEVSANAADPVVAVGWVGYVANGASASFSFDVWPRLIAVYLDPMVIHLYADGYPWMNLPAPPVKVMAPYTRYMPLVLKAGPALSR